MLKKVLILSAFAASLMSASALVSPADAAMRLGLPHPKPIGHKAIPYRHGHLSVAGLPGHHPAYHHRRHRAKPHHAMKHHAKASKSMDKSKSMDMKPDDKKPADAPKPEEKKPT